MACFLQRQFHHQWQNHGAIFLMKIEPESPRSSPGVLRLNTPAVPHQIQAIILKNCCSRSRSSLFWHGHPNGWSWSTMTGKSVQQWTISNPHLLMTTPLESTPWACVQACTPLKLSSCCKYRVYYTYIMESFLWQPSLHAISTLTSLFCGLIDMNMDDWKKTTYKSLATSPLFVQLKPSSFDLYLPDKESNLKWKKSKQLSRFSAPSLAWSIITMTISHVVPTYLHHLLHLPRKVPN
jgi:hypothetical protein